MSTDSTEIEQLWNSFSSKKFRDSYVSEGIDYGVSMQIRSNRKARGWTQKKLGELSGMRQNYICRLESPDSGAPNLETLKRIASAFDVALIVRLVPFSQLAEWSCGLGFGSMAALPFEQDSIGSHEVVESGIAWVLTEPVGGGFESTPIAVSHGSFGYWRDLTDEIGPSAISEHRQLDLKMISEPVSSADIGG